ncbi:MAG TPA: class I SAM-dependent methyltransferase [Patescibacteria group bacterium]|nr:class I SAM-dependent methyltransferase [Patescibacteria group bacterium]
MNINYKNYFKRHYKYSFQERDIENYKKWFYAQWKIINYFIARKKYKSCLEIGSGIGGFYQFVEAIIPHYKGVELDRAATKFSNAYWKSNCFFNTPFEKISHEKFDLIVAFEVLEHLENPNKSISKIYSLLKNKGMFVGTSPFPFAKNVRNDVTHLSVLHPENWKRLFLLNGFKKVILLPMSFVPFLWRINKRFNIRIPLYLPFPAFVSTCLIIAWK